MISYFKAQWMRYITFYALVDEEVWCWCSKLKAWEHVQASFLNPALNPVIEKRRPTNRLEMIINNVPELMR